MKNAVVLAVALMAIAPIAGIANAAVAPTLDVWQETAVQSIAAVIQDVAAPINGWTTVIPTAVSVADPFPVAGATHNELGNGKSPETLASLKAIHAGCQLNPPQPPPAKAKAGPDDVGIKYSCAEYLDTGVMVTSASYYGTHGIA